MKELELLNDPGFRNGFWVLGRTHKDGLLGAICWGEDVYKRQAEFHESVGFGDHCNLRI